MSKILSVSNLSVSFQAEEGIVKAVNALSFDLMRGTVTGIVGESGSGKSVSSLSIMRLIQQTNALIEGSIVYHNKQTEVELLTLNDEEMRSYRGNKIAMIFQEPMTSLNPVITCGKQITEVIRLHKGIDFKSAKRKTIALFEEVQLPRPEQLFDAYPHQLSGGQKQRVMIAMALSCDPELLIADEPTTALDVTVQKTIIELLLQLKKERGMSMIFISHDLGVIAEIADQVIVMYKGDKVESGKTEQIFASPRHPYTQGLLACRPSLDYRLKSLPVVSDFMRIGRGGSVENTGLTIEQVRNVYSYLPDEYDARKQKLYAQTPLLQVKNLNVHFPVKKGLFGKVNEYIKAVDGVSLEVYPGETLGLVGESGCGKTTLGRSILRLIEPEAEAIWFEGENILEFDKERLRKHRKKMQIIFQDPYSSLNPRFTIGRAIMEPMQVHQLHANDKQRLEKVIDLLERVGLKADQFNRYPHEFSGGQRQRICIARALALEPSFIICDESVSALDVSVQAQVLNLLAELREQFNLSYVFISHDLSVVKHISDRMLVMNKGKIVEMGDPDEIYHAPKDAYTQKLIQAIPKAGKSYNTNS